MIPLKFIRDNIEEVKKNSIAKNVKVDVDEIINIDIERRNIIVEVEQLKSDRNRKKA